MATMYWTGAVSGNYGVAGNWSGGAVPGAGDHVWLIDGDKDIDEGLDQSAVTLGSFNVDMTYTGLIGTRGAYLQIHSPLATIGTYEGTGTPTGSRQIKLDIGSGTACNLVIRDTATAGLTADAPPVYILANHASHLLRVWDGIVWIEDMPGDTGQIDELLVGSISGGGSPNVVAGSGLTIHTAATAYGGMLRCKGTLTNAEVRVRGGTAEIDTASAINTVTVNAGTAYLDRHGTITSLASYGGTTDTTRTTNARTVTTWYYRPTGTIRTDNANVTITNQIAVSGRCVITGTPL